MKKMMILLLFVLLFLSGLCGCADRPSVLDADTVLDAICRSQKDLPPASVVWQTGAPPETAAALTEDRAALLYDGRRGQGFPLLSRLKSARVRLADGLCGCEIHILQVADPADLPQTETLLRARLEELQRREVHLFLGDEYERNVAAGQVITRDRFVMLLTLPDMNAALDAVDRLF